MMKIQKSQETRLISIISKNLYHDSCRDKQDKYFDPNWIYFDYLD